MGQVKEPHWSRKCLSVSVFKIAERPKEKVVRVNTPVNTRSDDCKRETTKLKGKRNGSVMDQSKLSASFIGNDIIRNFLAKAEGATENGLPSKNGLKSGGGEMTVENKDVVKMSSPGDVLATENQTGHVDSEIFIPVNKENMSIVDEIKNSERKPSVPSEWWKLTRWDILQETYGNERNVATSDNINLDVKLGVQPNHYNKWARAKRAKSKQNLDRSVSSGFDMQARVSLQREIGFHHNFSQSQKTGERSRLSPRHVRPATVCSNNRQVDPELDENIPEKEVFIESTDLSKCTMKSSASKLPSEGRQTSYNFDERPSSKNDIHYESRVLKNDMNVFSHSQKNMKRSQSMLLVERSKYSQITSDSSPRKKNSIEFQKSGKEENDNDDVESDEKDDTREQNVASKNDLGNGKLALKLNLKAVIGRRFEREENNVLGTETGNAHVPRGGLTDPANNKDCRSKNPKTPRAKKQMILVKKTPIFYENDFEKFDFGARRIAEHLLKLRNRNENGVINMFATDQLESNALPCCQKRSRVCDKKEQIHKEPNNDKVNNAVSTPSSHREPLQTMHVRKFAINFEPRCICVKNKYGFYIDANE